MGADLRAALVASCLRGALPPVDLRAVCLVRAIGEKGVCDGRSAKICAYGKVGKLKITKEESASKIKIDAKW